MADNDNTNPSPPEAGMIEAIWRLLSSIRTALILILLIAVVTLAGTILVQAPPYATQSNELFQQWMETVRPKYGLWTSIFGILGLLNVFHSPLFAILLGLLSLNVIVCTMDRWPRIWRLFERPLVKIRPEYFGTAKLTDTYRANFEDPTVAASQLETALRQQGYRVRQETVDVGVCIYADRFAWSRLGTFFNHAGIVLVLLGGVIVGIFGFRMPGFVVPEGSSRAVENGTGLSVYVDSFGEESYPDGRPKDYWSDVVLFKDQVEVARRTIRVNDPLAYKLDPFGFREVRFHQSSFGNAVSLTIVDENSRPVFNDSVALAYSDADFGNRPIGYLNLYHQGIVLEIIGRIAGVSDPNLEAGDILVQANQVIGDKMRPAGMAKLSMREPKKVGNLTITFNRERQYTGLQVVYDPGNRIVWLACALMVIGLIMVFYFPVRRLRAMCSADGSIVTVRMAGAAERVAGFEDEFRRLALAIKRSLEAKPEVTPDAGQRGNLRRGK